MNPIIEKLHLSFGNGTVEYKNRSSKDHTRFAFAIIAATSCVSMLICHRLARICTAVNTLADSLKNFP